jgi:dTDP-4-dehydrorhamnose 3,5-epimerase
MDSAIFVDGPADSQATSCEMPYRTNIFGCRRAAGDIRRGVGPVMKFTPLSVAGAYLIEQEPNGDDRGFFARAYCENEFAAQGLEPHFVQANNSLSRSRGTLRGLHYQLGRHAEDKLIRCIAGAIFDVVLDLRPGSPTYLKHHTLELRAQVRNAVYIPRGCANGVQTLEPDTELFYLASNFYHFPAERGVRWNDPRFAITWPLEPAVLSAKDASLPDFGPAWHLDSSFD